MRISDVLRRKGPEVATIGPAATVAALVAALGEHRIGALVVSADGTTVAGIVSERDVVRALAEQGPALLDGPVSSIMTAQVHCGAPEDDLETTLRTMTDRRFRHVPVVVDGALTGIVSIGDIVKARMDELTTEREALRDYIASGG